MQRYQSQYSKESSGISLRGQSLSQSDIANPFAAVRQLKQADSQLDLMKRRLSLLKIKEQKNNRKSECALKKMKHHQYMQELEQRERESRRIYKLETQQKQSELRIIKGLQRDSQLQKIKEAKNYFQKAKEKQYASQKKTSEHIANTIKQNINADAMEKREKRLSVQELEKQSRKNYQIFILSKQSAMRSFKEKEQNRLQELKEDRDLKMREMMRLEMQMLERESKSRQAADLTHRRLNKEVSVSKPKLTQRNYEPPKTEHDKKQMNSTKTELNKQIEKVTSNKQMEKSATSRKQKNEHKADLNNPQSH